MHNNELAGIGSHLPNVGYRTFVILTLAAIEPALLDNKFGCVMSCPPCAALFGSVIPTPPMALVQSIKHPPLLGSPVSFTFPRNLFSQLLPKPVDHVKEPSGVCIRRAI